MQFALRIKQYFLVEYPGIYVHGGLIWTHPASDVALLSRWGVAGISNRFRFVRHPRSRIAFLIRTRRQPLVLIASTRLCTILVLILNPYSFTQLFE